LGPPGLWVSFPWDLPRCGRHCGLAKAVRGSIATAQGKRSDETIFRVGRQTSETMPCATWCHCKGGVMDIVVALLLLVSVGVFALHILDALRAS